MTSYALPVVSTPPEAPARTAYLIASGDLRESANAAGWPTQAAMEADVTAALEKLGWSVVRANDIDPATGHGFISSQRMGMEVFRSIPREAPLIVAEAVWQYSHHVLAGLRTHRGPILTVANFAGDWPVCRLNSTLRDWCTVLDEILSGETTDNLEKLYSRNARRLYRLTSLSGRASPFVMEHDSLTALPSHTAFQVHLSEKVKEAVRDGSSVGLAVMDLDHFSALNHAEGHSKGDELLIWLARVLANLIEEGEFAARIGGDEFALVLNSEGTSAMIARMERLRLQVEGHCQPVTLSVGIATYPRDARDAEELLKCVDDALYVAKRGGRNLVCASKSLEERFCKPIVDEDDSGPGSLVTRPDPPSGLSGGGAVRLP